MNRRDFLKYSAIILGQGFFSANSVFAGEKSNQRIDANLPSYNLKLFEDSNEIFSCKVAIGKGSHGRRETPIGQGVIYEKRKSINFRYGKNYPQYNAKKGDVIKWTNTFDKNGEPKGYKMPYRDMRGLGMKIKEGEFEDSTRFVIHSTTDEFTLGVPASGGCLRVGMQEMLDLYKLVDNSKNSGLIDEIPINLRYNLIDLKEGLFTFHANIYNKEFDLENQILSEIKNNGLKRMGIKSDAIAEEYSGLKNNFKKAQDEILRTLEKGFPNNFLSEELKGQLHRVFPIEDFI
ncbi:MAG TPA: L,D-transpeptidase [Candidatus Nanoarchaeia archaeon]|nr:L,D-transpeptidase [Candidatus Nanoarchaeia archaeon]